MLKRHQDLKEACNNLNEGAQAAENQNNASLGICPEGSLGRVTVAPAGSEVATVEYKINFLAAFQGGHLHATGQVVRAGKRIIVTTAMVTHRSPEGQVRDCAIMQQTLACVAKTY